jgi:hypothetical protein
VHSESRPASRWRKQQAHGTTATPPAARERGVLAGPLAQPDSDSPPARVQRHDHELVHQPLDPDPRGASVANVRAPTGPALGRHRKGGRWRLAWLGSRSADRSSPLFQSTTRPGQPGRLSPARACFHLVRRRRRHGGGNRVPVRAGAVAGGGRSEPGYSSPAAVSSGRTCQSAAFAFESLWQARVRVRLWPGLDPAGSMRVPRRSSAPIATS